MGQIFRPSTNTIARVTILGFVFILGLVSWVIWAYYRSAYATGTSVAREQPVPFSHKHHVSGLGIDCRYCHTTVETSNFAGIPPTETCMSCHSQIWTNAEMLAPVRASWSENKPLAWTRVNDVPDFVYFNHLIHVDKGVGCETCHGRVDQMPLTWRANTLLMEWCLDCHRHPERFVRPRDQVFTMGYQPAVSQQILGPQLVERYHIRSLTDCYTCHR